MIKLRCFHETEKLAPSVQKEIATKLSMFNGEILVHFNRPIFALTISVVTLKFFLHIPNAILKQSGGDILTLRRSFKEIQFLFAIEKEVAIFSINLSHATSLILFSFLTGLMSRSKYHNWPKRLLVTLKRTILALNLEDNPNETIEIILKDGKIFASCPKCKELFNVQRGKRNLLQAANFAFHYFRMHYKLNPPYPKCNFETLEKFYPHLIE